MPAILGLFRVELELFTVDAKLSGRSGANGREWSVSSLFVQRWCTESGMEGELTRPLPLAPRNHEEWRAVISALAAWSFRPEMGYHAKSQHCGPESILTQREGWAPQKQRTKSMGPHLRYGSDVSRIWHVIYPAQPTPLILDYALDSYYFTARRGEGKISSNLKAFPLRRILDDFAG